MEMGKAIGGRLVILLPMAYCVFLLIDSPDKMVRAAAIVALILLEQVREWILFSSIKAPRKGK